MICTSVYSDDWSERKHHLDWIFPSHFSQYSASLYIICHIVGYYINNFRLNEWKKSKCMFNINKFLFLLIEYVYIPKDLHKTKWLLWHVRLLPFLNFCSAKSNNYLDMALGENSNVQFHYSLNNSWIEPELSSLVPQRQVR